MRFYILCIHIDIFMHCALYVFYEANKDDCYVITLIILLHKHLYNLHRSIYFLLYIPMYCLYLFTCISLVVVHSVCSRAYLRGGGSGGSNSPPPEFSDLFLKSEGKAIERKRKKGCWGGGGLPLNIFLGLIFFRGELRNFLGGRGLSREGLNFFGRSDIFSGGVGNFLESG